MSRQPENNAPLPLKRLPARFRWYLAILVLLSGYLLLGKVSVVVLPHVLPAEACLGRGLAAVREGRYGEAECYLLAARAKAPRAEMADAALHVLYWHKYHDFPIEPYSLGFLYSVPVLKNWYIPYERACRFTQENRAERWLQREGWPRDSYRTRGVACKLFDDYYADSPREVHTVAVAMYAVQQGRYAAAYELLQQFEQQHTPTFRTFCHTAPLLLRNYTLAAAASGHTADAKRLTALYRKQPPAWVETYDELAVGIVKIDPARDSMAVL